MRKETNKEKILRFMAELGKAAKSPGRVYFTGGASAVLLGWRETTMDLDLKADPEPRGFFESIPKLKENVGMNIEFASPADFIPPLPGWQERSKFIAKEGSVTFLHYDFYAQALSKLERWHARDQLDVRRMLNDSLISKDRLLEFFAQIEPDLIRYPALHPADFRIQVEKFVRGEI